jgi:recombination protein RecT
MNAPRGAGEALKNVATDQTPTKATTNPAVVALNKALAGIGQVLPAHITKERMAKLALGMMRTNPKLASAARRNPSSFVNAIMHASKLGLEPGIDAHLVPYENRKNDTVEIQCIPDYRGLLKLARNSGEITSISIQIGYTGDEFDLSLGTDDKLTHRPKLTGDRGEPMVVYAVAKFRDGAHHVEWMPVADINRIRDGSQGYRTALRYKTDNPWISSWDEMARKTLARRISKYLPRSIELQNAERLMDAADKGVTAHFEGEFAVVDEDLPTTPALDDQSAPEPSQPMAVDKETGEISGAPAQDEGGPSLHDALALAKEGDYDGARSICPEPDRAALETAIKTVRKASKVNAIAE